MGHGPCYCAIRDRASRGRALGLGRVVGPNFSFETKKKQKNVPYSSYYKKYNGSCFMYLCEILSKLQMFKVTNFMTFSDGLQICVILLINHTH